MERVRAIIIQDGNILLIKRDKVRDEATFWTTPGGGVDAGEDHIQAVKRECLEECGVEVEVGNLIYQEISDHPASPNQPLFFYLCKITGGTIGTGQGPEFQPSSFYTGTHNPEWVKLNDIPSLDLRTKGFKDFLMTSLIAPLKSQ